MAHTAPCVSCLLLEVPEADLAAVGQLPPGALNGIQLLVPVGTSTDALGSTGATVAVLIGPSSAATPQGILFEARTVSTSLRAERPDLQIAFDGPAFASRGIPTAQLSAYADAIVGATWKRLRPLVHPSVDDLVSASLMSGSERVVLPARDVDWNAVGTFAALRTTLVEVSAARRLTAAGVVARYQAEQRRQDAVVRTVIGLGSTTLMFEVPDFAAPITVTAHTTIFRRGADTNIEQRDIRVNGAPIAGGGAQTAPQLPVVDAERLSTPPLRIALNEAYEYTIESDEIVAGSRCYVIGFRPRKVGRGVARGRAWIDTREFTLRRLHTIQSELRGAVVSSEQVDEFGPVRAGGTTLWLPTQTRIFQSYEGPGFRTPIHRTVMIASYDINNVRFDAQLDAAMASDHVMMRETPAGLRYLIRREKDDVRATTTGGSAVRSIVGGVLVDPNITRPLAFAGLSYVNFDLFGRGVQVNAFFGGLFGQLFWSVPSIAGSRWQAHGAAFGIAAKYTDRVFRNGREQYGDNLLQQPGYVSVGVTRSVTSRTRFTFDYIADVTALERTGNTAAQFVVPEMVVNHGAMVAVDADRGPWGLRAWWNPVVRYRWRQWGLPGAFDAKSGDFQRYGAQVRRSVAVRPSVASRLELSWMGGKDLDRFSRYGFGSFDNPLHGYPTASIRYDAGAVMRSATALTWRGIRIDGFGDAAFVRDAGWASKMRLYPGIGTGMEAGGPFRTLLSVEWAYGFRGSPNTGADGTHTVRVTVYKPF